MLPQPRLRRDRSTTSGRCTASRRTPTPGLTVAGKRELLSQLAAFAYALEADFSLLRVARPWSVDELRARRRGRQPTSATSHREALDALPRRPARSARGARRRTRPRSTSRCGCRPSAGRRRLTALPLARRRAALPRPRRPARDQPPPARRAARRGGQGLPARARLPRLRAARRRHELQWLIRRAFCRGVGDPEVDERFLPAGAGRRRRPRRTAAPATGRSRPTCCGCSTRRSTSSRARCAIETEEGDSHQAFLCLGALPEAVPFPGRRAELLFAPLEALDFPVDAAFSARYVPNERRRCGSSAAGSSTPTTSTTRRASGDHGPSANAAERPARRARARGLPDRRRPPAAAARRRSRSCVGAAERASELEERVERAAPRVRRRSSCTARSATSCGCSSATCPASPCAVARLRRLPDRRAVRRDGAGRHARGRRRGRPLHRPHADRRAPARAVRPDRGVAHEPRAGHAAGRHARLRQDAVHGADHVPGVPGRLDDLRHRPEGRPRARAAARRAPSRWR